MHQPGHCLCPTCHQRDASREEDAQRVGEVLRHCRRCRKGPEPVEVAEGVVRRLRRAA